MHGAARFELRDLPSNFQETYCNGLRLIGDVQWLQCIARSEICRRDAFAALFDPSQKRVSRGQALLFEVPGIQEKFFLRPVLHGGILGPFFGATLLRLTRPLQELAVTATLRAAGAAVPRPAFVLGGTLCGHRQAPLWRAAIATVAIENSSDGMAFFARRPNTLQIARATKAAARAIRQFHDCGGMHADLQIKNLLFVEQMDDTKVFLIDLDRAQHRSQVSAARRMQELMRLYRSLIKRNLLAHFGTREAQIKTAHDFLAAYTDGDHNLETAMLAHLRKEQWRVALHQLGYRKKV